MTVQSRRLNSRDNTGLRIGADGSWIRWEGGGLSRYLDELLHSMADVLTQDERLLVYYNSARGQRLFSDRVAERFIRLPNRTAWNQLRLPAALRADACGVYLGGAIVTPLAARIPCVPVVHDCLSFRDPSAKPGAEGRYWRRWTRAAARKAPRVIAISRFVADDCAAFLSVESSRVTVVHPGVGRRFTPLFGRELDDLRARLSATLGVPEQFLLHVGSFDRHKGASAAIGAARLLRGDGRSLGLVRCGPSGDSAPDEPGVVMLGHVDDATLIDLYRAAAVVCVTSTHEGFGLPVLEALACGTPVVATRTGGLPEAGGSAAFYAETSDPRAFAARIETILDASPAERAAHRAEGIEWAASFSWERAARQTLEIVRAVAASSRVGT